MLKSQDSAAVTDKEETRVGIADNIGPSFVGSDRYCSHAVLVRHVADTSGLG